jgi:hypothetical protein
MVIQVCNEESSMVSTSENEAKGSTGGKPASHSSQFNKRGHWIWLFPFLFIICVIRCYVAPEELFP